jgi:hypothetical protein
MATILVAGLITIQTTIQDAEAALRRALVFASYKIGEKGAAEGFLTEAELETQYLPTHSQ